MAQNPLKLRFLALGDSYTIGEAVPQDQSFPFKLGNLIENQTRYSFSEIQVIAKTGWTTDELLDGIEVVKPKGPFDFVSLLIGVNNQYRGYSFEQYKIEFEQLLKKAISFTDGRKNRVFVISIPDYGCTPFGKEKAEKIDKELKVYNQINKDHSEKQGITWIDIFEISKNALLDPSLIAEDQLHPSGKMYALWASAVFPFVKQKLA